MGFCLTRISAVNMIDSSLRLLIINSRSCLVTFETAPFPPGPLTGSNAPTASSQHKSGHPYECPLPCSGGEGGSDVLYSVYLYNPLGNPLFTGFSRFITFAYIFITLCKKSVFVVLICRTKYPLPDSIYPVHRSLGS